MIFQGIVPFYAIDTLIKIILLTASLIIDRRNIHDTAAGTAQLVDKKRTQVSIEREIYILQLFLRDIKS